ncbi:TRAP-type C4-dicarboxylate transport system permease small subunit [Rhodovulum bhavnagarense]|uniref:TRAP transporter small permease protein n=1 Tax=Rhodovulum bhavnagarense TaxID=992286 RepID=A0A4R2RF70_9RHOB|nr:TRAP transporter small permease [Rhodovulum bhavnagarense]TCP60939.1 TRAP-type C4-dicarboxylate transport system permease small subunit [Rhodovulum bhavnagarense]
MLRLFGLVDRAIGAVLRPVLAAGMAALIAVITLQIVSRVAFTAVGWTEEVARFLLVWLTFLGAVLAWQQHRHIAVGVLVDALPERAGRVVSGVALVAGLVFLLALAWIAQDYRALQSFQKSASLRIPMSYVYAVIPISALLMALLALSDLVHLAVTGKRPQPSEPVE